MSDLNDLFSAVDAGELMDDLKEYGMIAASAVASNVGFGMAASFALSKWPTAPEWVSKYAVPGAAILLGAMGAGYVGRYNRQAGVGFGVGLVSYGLSKLAKGFFPSLPLSGLGAEDQALLSADNYYGRYLSGAPVSVERVNGLGSAPMSIEQVNSGGVSGLGNPPMIETQRRGVGFAAIIQ